jgi:hypothetical protein
LNDSGGLNGRHHKRSEIPADIILNTIMYTISGEICQPLFLPFPPAFEKIRGREMVLLSYSPGVIFPLASPCGGEGEGFLEYNRPPSLMIRILPA